MSARELEQLLTTDAVTDESLAVPRVRIDGVLVGRLVGFQDGDTPFVTFPRQPSSAAVAARAAVDVRCEHIGGEVVLMFEEGDPWRPLIVGRLRKSGEWPFAERPGQLEVDADGQRLIIDAKEEITFRCGKASITLTKAGKVLIRGAYLLTHSSGVNRIRGGSVQIN